MICTVVTSNQMCPYIHVMRHNPCSCMTIETPNAIMHNDVGIIFMTLAQKAWNHWRRLNMSPLTEIPKFDAVNLGSTEDTHYLHRYWRKSICILSQVVEHGVTAADFFIFLRYVNALVISSLERDLISSIPISPYICYEILYPIRPLHNIFLSHPLKCGFKRL